MLRTRYTCGRVGRGLAPAARCRRQHIAFCTAKHIDKPVVTLLCGVRFTEPVCSVTDFIEKVKNQQAEIFTTVFD